MKLTRKTAKILRPSAIAVLLFIGMLCSLVGAEQVQPQMTDPESVAEPTQIVTQIQESALLVTPENPVNDENTVPVEIAEVLAESEPETVHTVIVEPKTIPDDLVKINNFTATAYYIAGVTSTGTWTTKNRTLAVNPRMIPFGTHVWLFDYETGEFIGDFYAEDSGANLEDNPYVVDIFFGENTEQECLEWGAPIVEIYYSASEKQQQ